MPASSVALCLFYGFVCDSTVHPNHDEPSSHEIQPSSNTKTLLLCASGSVWRSHPYLVVLVATVHTRGNREGEAGREGQTDRLKQGDRDLGCFALLCGAECAQSALCQRKSSPGTNRAPSFVQCERLFLSFLVSPCCRAVPLPVPRPPTLSSPLLPPKLLNGSFCLIVVSLSLFPICL